MLQFLGTRNKHNAPEDGWKWLDSLWLDPNISWLENGPFEDVSPIQNGGFPLKNDGFEDDPFLLG